MSKNTQWQNMAAAAYIIATFQPSEVIAPEGVDGGQHLRRLLMGDMGVNRERLTEMNADLHYAVNRGNLEGLRWSKQAYRKWLVWAYLESVNFETIYELLTMEEEK